MLNLPDKPIILPDLKDWQVKQMADLGNKACLDNIADQIDTDVDAYSLQMYWDQEPRHHLGASTIGHYCNRYIWMTFHWMLKEIPKARMTRLWYRGHREEAVMIQQLNGIGCTVKHLQDDGNQIRLARDNADGHFGGSLDALIRLPTRYGLPDQWHLLEMKTAADKYFKDMHSLGVYKSKEQYWKQMCVYAYKLSQMGTFGNIDYALFYAVNKNDDTNSFEFLKLDHQTGKEEIEKAEAIVKEYYAPAKFSTNPSAWQCKICKMYPICHEQAPVNVNCRSCKFAQPVPDGKWQCHKHNAIIPKEFLIKGCGQWESLPL